jgi:ABC-type branched-subunit amino acid transport system permease subunit
MNKCLSTALAATLAMATGACQQPTAQQINATNANSQVYIGALTCNVSGGSGYVFGSTKDLSCVYLTKAMADELTKTFL